MPQYVKNELFSQESYDGPLSVESSLDASYMKKLALSWSQTVFAIPNGLCTTLFSDYFSDCGINHDDMQHIK